VLLQLFRILNLCWAALMCSAVVLQLILTLPEPPDASIGGVAFWGAYLLVAIGTFFEFRTAWVLCITQLLAAWVLMGIAVSDTSFVFLTGQAVNETSPSISFAVFNSFFGVLVPASALLILLILSRDQLAWEMKHGRSVPATR
jgi:hypothetical protein